MPSQTERPDLAGAEAQRQDLETRVRQLAEAHAAVSAARETDPLLKKLQAQEDFLLRAHRTFTRKAQDDAISISGVAEWMLDNFYIVQQALRQIDEDLPPHYYRELPRLDAGSWAGYPRVFVVAWELVKQGNARLSAPQITSFVTTYQDVQPLATGELWALPTMLRICVLQTLALVVASTLDETAPDAAPPVLITEELSADTLAGNCILSLRVIANEQWSDFFEGVSLVEKTLDQDPAGMYRRMDFDTRDRYRKVVEKLAKATSRDELDVARAAIRLARREPDGGQSLPERQRHVGYYLVDEGRSRLATELDYRPPAAQSLHRWLTRRHPAFTYIGAIAFLTLILILVLLGYAARVGVTSGALLFSALLALVPAVTLATSLVNWLVPALVAPRLLPKMDFQDGVPAAARTMVVIPALIAGEEDIASLLHQLELHYLRNADPHITFALLTDFADAPHKEQPEDALLLRRARAGIQALNERYDAMPFYLFHRQRLWNPQENAWMGWERKRGKLEEFNRLLRGDDDTTFVVKVGDLSILPQVRYVITLDADTILPREAARRLIGAMFHPLNRPQFDPHTGRVVGGYTILQPRTEIKPVSANRSLFSRIFSGASGLDLYTHAVSDVYQDLFGEGIYVGKGIYDVDAFARSLQGCVPENALLSHDLFEGLRGRAGLATDIILFEDYPPDYLTYAHRLHRWIRGDWQLLPWLWSRVPHRQKDFAPNSFVLIDRWKIVDNMRRSLVAPAVLALMVAGWLWLPGSALVWTLLAFLAPAGPLLRDVVARVLQQMMGRRRGGRLPQTVQKQLARWLLSLAFLPYEALIALDAIITVFVRLFITRKRLLQWTTAAHTVSLFGTQRQVGLIWREMVGASLVALLLGGLTAWLNVAAFPVAFPFLLAWFLSPQLALWISRPVRRHPAALGPEQKEVLRRLSRSTWLYFEQFMGPDDHWLPPDHFQEHPQGLVAHRTSPTNIGLGLLATLAAYDFGYIGLWDLALRLQNSFQTLQTLEQYRGHFLNWYDTHTRKPLPPRYVSTVDSGNLAACLLVLRQGCLAIPQTSLPRWQRWQGLLDTLLMLDQVLKDVASHNPSSVSSLQDHLHHMQRRILDAREDPGQWTALLDALVEDDWPRLEEKLVHLIETRDLSPRLLHRIRTWTERGQHHLQDMRRRLHILLPWLVSLYRAPALFRDEDVASTLAPAWRALLDVLPQKARTADIAAICDEAQAKVVDLRQQLDVVEAPAEQVAAARRWCDDLARQLHDAAGAITRLLDIYHKVGRQCEQIVQDMSFDFLYDPRRRIFRIGYNVDSEEPDANYYDLLASEARIASLLAIAKGEAPQRHWLNLGRPLTQVDGRRTLVSWSGTMFEYLMPILWTRQYENTLLHESIHAAVEAQIAYAQKRGVPWGISESGYYRFDAAMNYQYRAFGVPGLGFKRGLQDDLVISPYATLLALPLYPRAVMENVERLRKLGMWGQYGFYEALDYTPARLGLGQEHALVQSYMVHHQGMILLSLANALQDDPMVRRFHADPRVQSVELLLQEKIPEQAPLEQQVASSSEAELVRRTEHAVTAGSWPAPISTPFPQAQYLANGRYGVLLTSAGGGYSHWQEFDLTRWRADTTRDDWGTWIYVMDRDNGERWSVATQPISGDREGRAVTFAPHKVDFQCQGPGVATHTEVTVPPEDDLEIRRVRLTNQGPEPRRLRLVTYAEVVLASQENDRRHPAFNKLFIASEVNAQHNALLFTRRPRLKDEAPPVMAHAVTVEPGQAWSVHYETDRERFLGRGGDPRHPAALASHGGGGTSGATLDPLMSLSIDIEVAPHSTATVAFMTLAAADRAAVLQVIEKYHDWARIDDAFQSAKSQSEMEMRRLELDSDDLQRFQRLLSLLCFPYAGLRSDPQVLAANEKGQSGLWAYAISGDYPILVARIGSEEGLGLARELLKAHIYWRNSGLQIDLVFINEQAGGYNQALQRQLRRLLQRMGSEQWLNRRGGVFLLQQATMSKADQTLLATAARVVLDARRGSLAAQAQDLSRLPARLPRFVPARDTYARPQIPAPARPQDLRFDNGWGGFSSDGREYIIYLAPGEQTPAPWVNVIANPAFGFLVSEAGAGFTWALNSGENRLTPWHNDPLRDPPGEALYLRDEETAQVWTPTPAPAGSDTATLVRHGAGYTVFEKHSQGLQQRLRLFAAPAAPLKIAVLRLENRWQHARRITATYYAEWVLGVNRETMQQYVIPEYDDACHALLARNPYNAEFGERVAFLAASEELHGLTADRTEFLGRLGDGKWPAALRRVGLTGNVHAGLDPCAALQVHVELQPGEAKEIYFLIGQGQSREQAVQLVQRFRERREVQEAWEQTIRRWDDLLGAVTVASPDQALNTLLNRWLPYQNLSCRIWGRSAFYQSSGAYGFRDQLQDVLAVLHQAPDVAREHILRAARHQFEAGDVLHWWHPPSGRGVRTRITDDLLWLPYVTAHYVNVTGDVAILREEIPFRQGDPLEAGEEERYGHYDLTENSETLYEHCCRALQKGTTSGSHGIPLMGAGDWNDGMNRVGIEGSGESVWLGWFLYATMKDFLPLCENMEDTSRVAQNRRQMTALKNALQEHAWDGDWYLRAFYDDGAPLGSAANLECQIDSIAQSWAVLSSAGDPQRARQAMAAVGEKLVCEDEQLLLLFRPPFDKTDKDPGYIKGYPPGIRENGGQYTHAAVWSAWAFAALGQGDRAGALFRLLNPILHSDTKAAAQKYRVEPYVTAADVYSVDPFTGRGGWTWYTGSGGWLYRLGLETILGLRREREALRIDPCIPHDWQSYAITYRHGGATYHIRVENPDSVSRGVRQVTVDGQQLPDGVIPLQDDGASHDVRVRLGPPS